MGVKIFIDTNILVYAHDKNAGEKYHQAISTIEKIIVKTNPYISFQVLNELLNCLRRKGMSGEESIAIVEGFLNWNIINMNADLFKLSIKIHKQYKISVWDSSILAAAVKASANELWTEDLNSGQEIEGVKIVNPFSRN